jgi:hypothetical protein
VIENIKADVKAIMGKETPVLVAVFKSAIISQTQLPVNDSIQSNVPIRQGDNE